jgi:tetratricopeptide (TPR) repeat protein
VIRLLATIVTSYIKPTYSNHGVIEKAPLDDGAVIQSFAPGSAAAKAGLQPGDAIVRIDNQSIKQRADVAVFLSKKAAGDTIRVTFVRDDKEQTVGVVLGPSQAPAAAPPTTAAPSAASSITQQGLSETLRRYRALSGDASKALADKDYARAADLYRQQADLMAPLPFDGGRANYNLACVLAHLDRKDEALKALNTAVDQGFSDVERIKSNSDLKSLQGEARFAEAVGRAERAERAKHDMYGENPNWPKPTRKSFAVPPGHKTLSTSIPGALRAIAFLDDNVGYAAGEEGLCQMTADGGQTWRKIDTGSKAIYRFILPLDKNTIFLCGDSDPNASVVKKGHTFLQFPMHYSTVSYTRDGGKAWTNVVVPTGFMLMSLARLDDATLLMIASTYDAHNDSDILIFHVGGSWTDGQNVFQGGSTTLPGEGPRTINGKLISAHRGGRALKAMCRIDDKHFVSVGCPKTAGSMQRPQDKSNPDADMYSLLHARAIFSSDGGVTWKSGVGSEGRSTLRALAYREGAPLVAVGDNGEIILLSHDKGATWSKTNSPVKVPLTGVTWSAGNPSIALAVGEKGVIAASFDQGKTWASATVDDSLTFTAVTALRDGFAATTEEGKVVRLSPADLQRYFKMPAASVAAEPSTTPELSMRERFQKYSALSQELPKAAAAKDSAKLLNLLQQQVAVVGKSGFDHGAANFNLACVLARMGRKDDAFKALNLAVDQGYSDADRIKGANNLKSLRGDKRFAAVIKRADPDADDETSEPVPPTAEKPAKEKAVPKKSAM